MPSEFTLSPSALAAVPEVRNLLDAIIMDVEEGWPSDRSRSQAKRDLAHLIEKVRDAVLSAERERVLGMTEAQVVEEAHRVAGLAMGQGLGTRYFSELDQEYFGDAAKLAVRAALPLLLAPERARREQAERERDDLRIWAKKMEKSLDRAEGLARTNREHFDAAEAERDRLREALEEIVNADPVGRAWSLERARAALSGRDV